jgi:hypothetical protein
MAATTKPKAEPLPAWIDDTIPLPAGAAAEPDAMWDAAMGAWPSNWKVLSH